MEYMIILLGVFSLSLFLEYKYRIKLFNSRKQRIIVSVIFFIIGSIWDSFAIWRGHWSFSGSGLLGITIGLMPLEEYLFIIILPYFILTVYRVLKNKF